jgi:hypothetical protein
VRRLNEVRRNLEIVDYKIAHYRECLGDGTSRAA